MAQTKGWALYYLAGGRVRHLVPKEDTMWHERTGDCACHPDMEWLRGEGNVRIGRLYTHQPADGRRD